MKKKMETKILVTGASGNLGGLVVKSLLEKTDASNIVVMVRDRAKAQKFEAEGVEVRTGDYNEEASMTVAFQNIEKVYFVSGTDLEKRDRQHRNVVKAAMAARVAHVIYTSFAPSDYSENSPLYPVAKGHLAAEDSLKNSGLVYTILKHNLYMDVIPFFAGENLLDSKTIYFPAKDGKAAFMARKDMAVLAAEILTGSGHENKIYEVGGDRSYSFHEIASLITEVSRKEITYFSPSVEEFETLLKAYGISEQAILISVMFAQGIANGDFDKTTSIFKDMIGKEITPLKDFLEMYYGSINRSKINR